MKRTIVMVMQRHNGYTQQRWRDKEELELRSAAASGTNCQLRTGRVVADFAESSAAG